MSEFHRRGPTRLTALAATALAAALALAGCGASSTPEANTTNGAETTAADRTLSVAAVSAPNSLDPSQLVDGQQMFVWGSVLDTLLRRDPQSGALLPGAAETWEYNEDGTELTLTLRKGMTFSTGDPVNAEAVSTTLLRGRDTPGALQSRLSTIKDAVATDDTTVVVSFSAFDPQFVDNLAQGPGAIGDPATMTEERTATDPVGSGPFTLDTAKTVPGSVYVLNKRDDYWDAENVPFSTMTVRVLQDPTASFNALQAGELNAATVQTPVLGQLDKSKHTVTTVDAAGIAFLNILDRGGEKFPALGDQRVRQAINMSIDREGILKGLFNDTGLSAQQTTNPYGKVFSEDLNETYPYDPEAGKKLVEEAGFAGETFKIPSTFLSTSIESTLKQSFSDIGLNLEWETVPPQQAQAAARSGDYGLYYQILGFNSDAADLATVYGPAGFANPTGYTDEKLNGFFEAINSTIAFEDVIPTYEELNEYVVDQAFTVPVIYTGTNWVTEPGVEYVGKANALTTYRLFKVTE